MIASRFRQIAAVAVTIPGLLYLRRSGGAHPSPSGHSTHGEGQVKRAEPVKKESKPEPKMEPREEPIKEAKEDTSEQKTEMVESENVSSSASEAAPTASTASSSGKGETKERDESQESVSRITARGPDPTLLMLVAARTEVV